MLTDNSGAPQRPTILVVDDHRPVAYLIEAVLAQRGFRVRLAFTAAEVLTLPVNTCNVLITAWSSRPTQALPSPGAGARRWIWADGARVTRSHSSPHGRDRRNATALY